MDAFEEFGYPCPDQENPADHLMDTVTPASDMNSTNNSITPEVEKALIAKYGRPEVDLAYGSNQPIQVRAGGPFFGGTGALLLGDSGLLRQTGVGMWETSWPMSPPSPSSEAPSPSPMWAGDPRVPIHPLLSLPPHKHPLRMCR